MLLCFHGWVLALYVWSCIDVCPLYALRTGLRALQGRKELEALVNQVGGWWWLISTPGRATELTRLSKAAGWT